MKVRLDGGPFHGAEVEVDWGTTLSCQGDPVEDGYVATYRPTRELGVYRYRSTAKIVAVLPVPS